jgi:uncharacterized phage protein (TIGR02218 family)
MKTAPGALTAWLALGGNNREVWRADLVSVFLRGNATATPDYVWTTWDRDLTVAGTKYLTYPGGPLVRRGSYSQNRFPTIDTLDMVIGGAGFLVAGKAIGLQAATGYFDGARVRVDHILMPSPGDVSLGPITGFFEGRVSGVEPQGTDVRMRLKSEVVTLSVKLPRFLIQSQCMNGVYDANCAASLGGTAAMRATFSVTGAIVTGSPTTTTFTTSNATIQGKATGFYALGVLTFTSGANVGLKRSVLASTTGTGSIVLAQPLPVATAPGDTFTIYPGCDHSRAWCNTTFGNLSQWRGYPHVPSTEGGAL